jgi:uncharacterized protein (UPF0332 family)
MKKLKPQRVDWHQISRYLGAASKKLTTAKKILLIDEEACYQQAYDAMLKASLGFMLSHGVRPRSQPGHHVAIIEFAESHLDKEHHSLVVAFDRMRRKRNQALYEVTGVISKQEAEQAVQIAERFLAVLRSNLQQRSPQGKLS